MRFLLALVASIVVTAYAHHSSKHSLKYPEFLEGRTHFYDVAITSSASVPGLSAQVSKSVIQMNLQIYATPKTSELIFLIKDPKVKNSVAGVGSDSENLTLSTPKELKEMLEKPFTAIYEKGVIKSYTLEANESVESAKIKRTILRNLEVYLDQTALGGRQKPWHPITYNRTKSTPLGAYKSHYIITSSPYAAFPKDKNVYNISRVDNYEVIPYLAYRSHHNFEQQGCPEVCKKEHTENPYNAGCPVQQEPYNTPLKRSFYQKHNLRMARNGELFFDQIETTESHTADLYDQNMEIFIESIFRWTKLNQTKLEKPTGQNSYNDLNNWSIEINENEIKDRCHFNDPKLAVETVKHNLNELTAIIVTDTIDDDKSKIIGEEVILLQRYLRKLKKGDLRNIQRTIVNYDDLKGSSEMDKVKRQIWMDILPLIGSNESVSFIVEIIAENINKPNPAISLWESKTILEALPMNILEPSEKTIKELSTLLEVINNPNRMGYSMFFSASHLAVSRVIQILCSVGTGVPEVEMPAQRNWKDEDYYRKVCPKTIVKQFVSDIARKLKSTTEKSKRVIYIQALARTGLPEVLKVLKHYVYGHIEGLSHSYIDYVRTVTIHSLYHVAQRHPRMVLDLITPIYFNTTEPAKIRNSVFGVMVKSQPTLGLLQQIAEVTWTEPSQEVASYVTSTLETFGNSTIPCHQLTARRIKKILPLINRSVSGKQHAQNNLWTLFDSVRGFGLENRFEFTPSNESFIPSVIYAALGAHVDSFRDIFFQLAVNSQGLTSRNVWDKLLKEWLKISPAQDIPKDKESEIFAGLPMSLRDPEFWRVTFYEKHFYSSSYYYYDGEGKDDLKEIIELVKDQYDRYLTNKEGKNLNGHLARIYIPSSYEAKSIALTMPSTVEFQMKNPLVISVKMNAEFSAQGEPTVTINPSFYYSTIYTNQFLNLGDCKNIGVYYQRKVAGSYPITLSGSLSQKLDQFSFSYKFPELPKTVFTYHSEAGSYAGDTTLNILPEVKNRRTFKTLPSQFERKDVFGILGFPAFSSHVLTEDIQFGYDEVPRNSKEAMNLIVRSFLNAGWRRKSVVIQRVSNSNTWTADSMVKIHFNISRKHIISRSNLSEKDWSRGMKLEDNLKETDVRTYATEASTLAEKLKVVAHMVDRLSIRVEKLTKSTPVVTCFLNVTYNHTYGGFLHTLEVNTSAISPKLSRDIGLSATYTLLFNDRPDEFYYGDHTYGHQTAVLLGSVSFPQLPGYSPMISSKAVFNYTSLEHVLKKEMSPPLKREHFLPETHQECLKDVKMGKSQSVACIKAIREMSIFNRVRFHAVWEKDFPELVQSSIHQLDLALKHAFFSHMVSKKTPPKPTTKHFYVDATYIDKMTDSPVVDVVITKPTEVLEFKRVSTGYIQPFSSLYSVYDTYMAGNTNNSYPATCSLMDHYVRTYDMKTFKLPREDIPTCQVVLSTHCTENKKFAVIVKIDPESSGTEEIHIYLGNDEYVLVKGRKSGEYVVRINETDTYIKSLQPVMFDEDEVIYASVYETNTKNYPVEFHAKKAGIVVTYNGKNVKVQVHPRYKGELCGLCSEFNGEYTKEFVGPDKCLYSHQGDFYKSAMIGDCAARNYHHPKVCHEEEDTAWSQGYEPTMKRNVVLQRDDKFCFSTKPVPACENEVAITSETHNIDFHCLPKADRNARKLVMEAKRRILGELETKTVHITEPVDVPTMC